MAISIKYFYNYYDCISINFAVCGDSNCETVEGENCETCPKDCGKCPLKTWEIALIAAAGVIFVGTIVSIYGVS